MELKLIFYHFRHPSLKNAISSPKYGVYFDADEALQMKPMLVYKNPVKVTYCFSMRNRQFYKDICNAPISDVV